MTRSIHENQGPANGRTSEKKASSTKKTSSVKIGHTDSVDRTVNMRYSNKMETPAPNPVQVVAQRAVEVQAGAQTISSVSRAQSMRNAVNSLLTAGSELEEALINIGALHNDNLGYAVRALRTDCPMDQSGDMGCDSATASAKSETVYPVGRLTELHVQFNAEHVSVPEALNLMYCGALSVQAMLRSSIDGELGGVYSLELSIDDEDRTADNFLDTNYLGRTVCNKGISIETSLRSIQHSVSTLYCSLTGGESVERDKRVQPCGIIDTLLSLEGEVSHTANDINTLVGVIRSQML